MILPGSPGLWVWDVEIAWETSAEFFRSAFPSSSECQVTAKHHSSVVSVFVYTITRIFARAYLVESSSPFQETIAAVAIDSRFRRNRGHFPSHANISPQCQLRSDMHWTP